MKPWPPGGGAVARAGLTKKDVTFLSLVTLRNDVIAHRMGCSESAVRARSRRLFDRFGCISKAELVVMAIALRVPMTTRPEVATAISKIADDRADPAQIDQRCAE